jgi:anti-anti-sigma regulatory factor
MKHMAHKGSDEQVSPVSQDHVLALAGMQDISQVQMLYQQLSDALEADTPITFDASQTERLDAAVAQLLLAFTQTARSKSQAVVWRQPSDAFLDAVKLLGLGDELGVAA